VPAGKVGCTITTFVTDYPKHKAVPEARTCIRALESLKGDLSAIESALGYISGVGGNARTVTFVCDASGTMINKFTSLNGTLIKTDGTFFQSRNELPTVNTAGQSPLGFYTIPIAIDGAPT
jgi:hypothetical protein